MISVIPTTERGDATVVLIHPDGHRVELTHGDDHDMRLLAGEVRDWCEGWCHNPPASAAADLLAACKLVSRTFIPRETGGFDIIGGNVPRALAAVQAAIAKAKGGAA